MTDTRRAATHTVAALKQLEQLIRAQDQQIAALRAERKYAETLLVARLDHIAATLHDDIGAARTALIQSIADQLAHQHQQLDHVLHELRALRALLASHQTPLAGDGGSENTENGTERTNHGFR